MHHTRLLVVGSLVLSLTIGTFALAVAAPKDKGKPPAKKPGKGKVVTPPASAKALIAAGKKAYTTAGCMGCHAIAGKGGAAGPDLSKVGKAHKAAWIATKIRNPQKATPNSPMPPYGPERLKDKDLKAITAYLASLK